MLSQKVRARKANVKSSTLLEMKMKNKKWYGRGIYKKNILNISGRTKHIREGGKNRKDGA